MDVWVEGRWFGGCVASLTDHHRITLDTSGQASFPSRIFWVLLCAGGYLEPQLGVSMGWISLASYSETTPCTGAAPMTSSPNGAGAQLGVTGPVCPLEKVPWSLGGFAASWRVGRQRAECGILEVALSERSLLDFCREQPHCR